MNESDFTQRFGGFTIGALSKSTTASSTNNTTTTTTTATGTIFGASNLGTSPSTFIRPALEVPSTSTTESNPKPIALTFSLDLESPWRKVEWTEDRKKTLMKTVSTYKPRTVEKVSQARVLLLGPIGSGKSSFISSVQSVFNGRVTNRAMVGSLTASFTKKLQSFSIRSQNGDPTGLLLCDSTGLGDGLLTGLTLHDALSVIKGNVPEGHKFSPDQPVNSETQSFVAKPNLKDRIHCVAFVVDASKVLSYSQSVSAAFRQLRKHISDLGVHQVALLTHIDKICTKTAKDVSYVYTSRTVRETMEKAAVLLGMSQSYIVPVKNYSSELEVDVNTDVLLLNAVDHILQYADLYFHDNTAQMM